jgi:hypothetical protein
MIGEGPDAVGNKEAEPPVTKAEFSEPPGQRSLQSHDQERYQRRPRIPGHQLPYFGMCLNDGASPGNMRMLKLRLEESSLH